MELKRYPDAKSFYARVEPFLLTREADHCLPIGLCSTMIAMPDFYPNPYLVAVEENDEVIAAVVMTPPYDPVLTSTDRPEALRLFVDDLVARYKTLGGALGPVNVVSEFVRLWQAATGQPYRVEIHERIFQLTKVNPVTGVPGFLRRAEPRDRDLLIQWREAFGLEALGVVDLPRVVKAVDENLKGTPGRGDYLWEDSQPVSLAAYAGPTPNGIRIGPVYTPPEFRGRGYASACVAGLSQLLLDEGRKYCFLFTDLSNPTSNHIYQVIGYEPVCDFDKYIFDPPLHRE